MGIERIARRRYTPGPTPLEHLPRLSSALGGPEIWIKRDDLTGLTGGGNKTRKLEFLVADAIAQGADTLVTTGAVQSNHCRLTVSAAVKEGMRSRLVLEERVPGSYAPNSLGNNFLYRLLGTEAITVVPGGSDLVAAMEEVAEAVRADGGIPYIIPGGGSNALGALGYVTCAHELLTQLFDAGLGIDHLIAPSGSGGTHAGLLAGLADHSSDIPVTGISVNKPISVQEPKILDLANQILELLDSPLRIGAEKVRVLDHFVGEGYSLPTPEMAEAIQLFARTEGILLDPVYTGKQAAGLIGMIRSGELSAGQKVLFLHTGGAPALSAYPGSALPTA